MTPDEMFAHEEFTKIGFIAGGIRSDLVCGPGVQVAL